MPTHRQALLCQGHVRQLLPSLRSNQKGLEVPAQKFDPLLQGPLQVLLSCQLLQGQNSEPKPQIVNASLSNSQCRQQRGSLGFRRQAQGARAKPCFFSQIWGWRHSKPRKTWLTRPKISKRISLSQWNTHRERLISSVLRLKEQAQDVAVKEHFSWRKSEAWAMEFIIALARMS